MKSFFVITVLLAALVARAEEVKVGVDTAVPAGKNEETVITVKKSQIPKEAAKYEIHDGGDDITGDTNVLKKTAEQNWKKACADWTKEFKAQNKEGIVSFSCGKMTCTKEGVESTCTSKAKYKLRVLTEKTN